MPSTLIDNQWVLGEGDELISSTPDESKTLWKENTSSVQQVADAVLSAKQSQKQWAKIRLDDRIKIVEKFAEQLKENQETFANAISEETGKPLWEAKTEVTAMVNKVVISIKAQNERAGFRHKNHLSLSHHAHGVMAVFGPFNFPGHLPNGHIVPALLAGNSVVFKPSELTPWVAELTAKMWIDAGLPKGVLNLVQGGKEVGEALVDADINGVLFTGSYTTGKIIHQKLAGRPEILLALEMGGNNPLVVGQVSNLEVTANTILHSAYLSAGQRCTCARRLIVVENEKTDELLKTLQQMCERMIVGKPQGETEPFMGSVINNATAEKLLRAQETLIASGAQAIQLMAPLDDTPALLSPGILDVSNVDDIEDDEHFGPLLQVYRVADFESAIELANATRYGLAAGLLSDSVAEHEIFKQQIRAGVISINMPTAGASSELPFGGIGASGNHRPSAYYAADYCAWPQALSQAADTQTLAENFDLNSVRGLR